MPRAGRTVWEEAWLSDGDWLPEKKSSRGLPWYTVFHLIFPILLSGVARIQGTMSWWHWRWKETVISECVSWYSTRITPVNRELHQFLFKPSHCVIWHISQEESGYAASHRPPKYSRLYLCHPATVSVHVTSHEPTTILWQTIQETCKCGSVLLCSLS